MKISELVCKLEASDARNVIEFAEDLRSVAASTADLEQLLAQELVKSNSNFRYPPRIRSRYAFVIASGSWFLLELVVLNVPDFVNPVTTEIADSVYAFLTRAECVAYDLIDYQNEVFSTHSRARPGPVQMLAAGDSISLDAAKKAVSLRAPEPVVALILSSKEKKLFGWEFDNVSGSPLQHFNNYPVVTMFELMAGVMGCYGDDAAVQPLSRLLAHRSGTVRWEAARALLAVDAAKGRSAFKQLANDLNARLAERAQTALAQIEGGVSWQSA